MSKDNVGGGGVFLLWAWNSGPDKPIIRFVCFLEPDPPSCPPVLLFSSFTSLKSFFTKQPKANQIILVSGFFKSLTPRDNTLLENFTMWRIFWPFHSSSSLQYHFPFLTPLLLSNATSLHPLQYHSPFPLNSFPLSLLFSKIWIPSFPLPYCSSSFSISYTVQNEMKFCRETEKLHELVHDTIWISS